MDQSHIDAFMAHLAVQQNTSANTQRAVLNALVFLFREFLGKEMGEFVAARRGPRSPVVFSHAEAARLIQHLEGDFNLMV